jgi:catechol 2,3-dioxygenase-like lactoylglutathione lyase family enzyme
MTQVKIASGAETRQGPCPPAVNRVLETSLYVASLARSEAFYRGLFGFTVLRRDARMCALAIPGREVLLLFVRGGSVEPGHTPFGVIPPHDGRGTQHVCFSIDRDGLDAWARHLVQEGIEVESRVVWPGGGTSLYFRDPDQHSLEVATPGLWANDPLTG